MNSADMPRDRVSLLRVTTVLGSAGAGVGQPRSQMGGGGGELVQLANTNAYTVEPYTYIQYLILNTYILQLYSLGLVPLQS